MTGNELSQAIIAAVVDEHSLETEAGITRFTITKRSRRGPQGS